MTAAQVTVLCATLNARDAVQLTFETFFEHTPEPVRVVVVDNGSTDGTVEALTRFPRIETVDRVATVPSDRLHGATLDWLVGQVATRYFLTLDSDVEFLRSGWLSDLLTLADRVRATAAGEYEPGWGTYRPRLAPHVLLVATQRFRALGGEFRARVTIDDPDQAAEWLRRPAGFQLTADTLRLFPSARFYPTGSVFFERIRSAGDTWAIVPALIAGSYRHLGHMSWAGNTPVQDEVRTQHVQRQAYVRARLRARREANEARARPTAGRPVDMQETSLGAADDLGDATTW